MVVNADVVFIGCKQDRFTNKKGDLIQFQRVTFVPDGDSDAMSLTALMELDFSSIAQLSMVTLRIDFYEDVRTKYLKGKIVGIG